MTPTNNSTSNNPFASPTTTTWGISGNASQGSSGPSNYNRNTQTTTQPDPIQSPHFESRPSNPLLLSKPPEEQRPRQRRNVPPPKASLLTLGQKDQQQSNTEFSYQENVPLEEHWVIVYGFRTLEQREFVWQRFSQYGSLLDSRLPLGADNSNWMALRFETALQAEKALCHPPFFVEGGNLVGVSKGTKERMDMLLTSSSSSSREHHTFLGRRSGRDVVNRTESDVLLSPPHRRAVHAYQGDGSMMAHVRRDDICGKIMAWIFSW